MVSHEHCNHPWPSFICASGDPDQQWGQRKSRDTWTPRPPGSYWTIRYNPATPSHMVRQKQDAKGFIKVAWEVWVIWSLLRQMYLYSCPVVAGAKKPKNKSKKRDPWKLASSYLLAKRRPGALHRESIRIHTEMNQIQFGTNF